MIPQIKICGIRFSEEIQVVNRLEVDYVGFVFAKSKRRITLEQAALLKKKLRKGIKAVGVFTDMSGEEICKAAEVCNLDIVQLHGNQSDEDIKSLPLPVWKSISMKNPESVHKTRLYPSACAFVFDTFAKGMEGGTGIPFQWQWISGLSDTVSLVLAGGLNPNNIRGAIEIVKPHIVDVSSGVEGNMGKDEKRVIEFIKAVKTYEYGI